MRIALSVLILSCAAVACAQEHKTAVEPQQPMTRKRLQSVTWDLMRHKLVWVVERGELQGSDFVVRGSDRYEISPDEAVMQFAEERRGFADEEAATLHKLLDTLSIYCAESVVWWDQGQGTRLDKDTDKDEDHPKSEPVEHPKKQPTTDPENTVAMLRMAIARTLR